MTRTPDLTGQRFGFWTVLSRVENASNGNAQWLCRCRCGLEKVMRATRLRSSKTSHGCYNCVVKTGYGEITGDHWGRIKYGAVRRQLQFDLTIEDAWGLFQKQQGRCVLSGLELSFKPKTASLDRIDSSQGYTNHNVQWVHKDINRMKQDFSEERFRELCRLVTSAT